MRASVLVSSSTRVTFAGVIAAALCGWLGSVDLRAEDSKAAPAPPTPAAAPAPAPAPVPVSAPIQGLTPVTVAAPASDPVRPAAPVVIVPGIEEVRASHILMGSQEEAAKVREEIVLKGGDGKAFASAARKYSKDTVTKPLGGDLGYFTRQAMDRAFSDAAFKLNLGDVSQPVQSSFGWHLILSADRRERERPRPQTPVPPVPPVKVSPVTTPGPQAGPNDLAPPAVPAVPAVPVPPTAVPADAKRLPVTRDPSLRLTLTTTKAWRGMPQQASYVPDQAVEVNLVIANEGSKPTQFFAKELLSLGLKVTPLGESAPLAGDFASVADPGTFIVTLKPYEIAGISSSLNDTFKTLSARRFRMGWDATTFFTNLEARFPAVKDLPEYATLSASLKKPQAVMVDTLFRDSMRASRGREIPFSIFGDLRGESKKVYAQILLANETQPVTIELNLKDQNTAARHFANLVLEGFYDTLNIFDVTSGDFLLAGCPLGTGTGAPNGPLPLTRNTAKLDHKRGTVAFVSRSVRTKGPIQGGQIGSIFVVCLKPHPEWNEEHVPFGEVVGGLEILDRLQTPVAFRQVTLISEDQYKGGAAATPAPAPTPPPASITGNPEAILKTSKGDLTVELFEDAARNTVYNFVDLASKGFYSKDAKGDGKQKFFFVMKNEKDGKPLLILTGSPTNDYDGSPGYSLRSEMSGKKCIRGALVMAVETDTQTGRFLPDTAGSQFFICLGDIAYYDSQPALTVFGQVTVGLDLLDKLAEGDTLDSVEIAKKKGHPYRPVTVPNR
jgi:cyclophilin family peptidyl-prolyl cis-trans isomerase